MKWNIYSRVTVLEQQVKDLTDFSGDQSRMIVRLQERLHKLEISNSVLIKMNEINEKNLKDLNHVTFAHSRLLNSAHLEVPPAPNLADEERLKKRQYQRERYAKRKAKKEEEGKVKSQREKKNAYARAYYARTKGVKK